jgi:DNA polymerase-3 subunit delta'
MSDEIETDREPGCAHPRESFGHLGFADAEQTLLTALASGRMHHAWLITGPKGVGKATLAYRLARRLLGAAPQGGGLGSDPDDPVVRQVAAQSHPDLLVLRRPVEDGKARKAVTVEEARRLPDFFAKAPAMGGWRVAIIDSADDMNDNAANAILKTLEEPPERGVVLVLAHAPGRLLPTIRSRCRQLRLTPLSDTDIVQAVQRVVSVDGDRAAALARLAHGAPGRALALAAAGGVELYDEILNLLSGLPNIPELALLKLADRLKPPAAEAAYRLATRILYDLAAVSARDSLGITSGFSALSTPEAWARLAQWIEAEVERADGLNFDRAETLLAIFDAYARVAENRFVERISC